LSYKDSNGIIRETATYMRGIRNGRSQHFINGRLSVTQFYFDDLMAVLMKKFFTIKVGW